MERDAKIYVAGHRGMVGSAIVRTLKARGFTNLVMRTHAELDLRDTPAVQSWFDSEMPEYVFLAAARVGGIMANDTYPVEFLTENIQIQNNVIHSAYRVNVRKLLFLGSSCIYPKLAAQPINEDELLCGPLEPTNEAYAIAKIAGITLCQAFRRQYGANYISVMPTNLYGPNDNFDLESSHVLPALLRKFHTAKATNSPYVMLWGSGTPRREFLHADDLSEACLFLMENYDQPEIINIGVGEDISIRDLAELIQEIVGYKGVLEFDPTKPDGTPRKLLDVSRLTALGWKARIDLEVGIRSIYETVDKRGWI